MDPILHLRDIQAELDFANGYEKAHGKRPAPHEVNVAIYGQPSPMFREPGLTLLRWNARRAIKATLDSIGAFAYEMGTRTVSLLLVALILYGLARLVYAGK